MNKIIKKWFDWLKDPLNLAFFIIILISILIRVYFLALTKTQALWWDEAEYLSIAREWAYGTPIDEFPLRPMFLPFIAYVLFKFGFKEFSLRIIEVLFSTASIIIIYLLAKKLFNKPIALMSSILMSVHYLNLFFSFRILTELPSMTFWIASLYFFWKGYVKKESHYYIWLCGLITALGVLMRFPVGIIVFIYLIYLLVTEKLKFLKNKNLWIAAIIFLITLTPYIIFSLNAYGNIPVLSAGKIYPHKNLLSNYLALFPSYFASPIPLLKSIISLRIIQFTLIAFILGFIYKIFMLAIGFNLIKESESLKKDLLILLSIVLPFLYFTFYFGIFDDRYPIFMFAGAFIIISEMFYKLYKLVSRYNTNIAFAVILIIMVISAHAQLLMSSQKIREKLNSYQQLKDAGIWIKDHSNQNDLILSSAAPQTTYYAERKTMGLGFNSEEEFLNKLKELKPRFLELSIFEKSPDWMYLTPQKYNSTFVPVYALFSEDNKNLLLAVYEIRI